MNPEPAVVQQLWVHKHVRPEFVAIVVRVDYAIDGYCAHSAA